MAIHVQCKCGQSFTVPGEMAGRRAKCKTCGSILQFPPSEAAAGPVPTATSSTLSPQVAVPIAQPVSVPPGMAQPASPQPTNPAPANPAAAKALAYFNKATQSQAANPGKLFANPFLYLRAYPGGMLLGGSCLVVSLLLTCLHSTALLLVLGSGWLCWRVWFGMRFDFIGGCINPAMVVSLDPPRVATSTNLGRGGDRPEGTPVIIVEKHPLKYMLGGMPQVGQRVPAVLTYVPGKPDAPHWDDCAPKLPACVTRNREELARIYQSISEEDWQQLEQGLRQIPPPLNKRTYRTFAADVPPPTDAWLATHLEQLVLEILSHDTNENQCVAACGIPAEIMAKAQEEVAKGIAPSEILAICGGSYFVSGFVVTRQGIVIDFVRGERTFFRWQDIRGALFCTGDFEITHRDFSRVHLCVGLNACQASRVEGLINSVASSDSDGWRP